MLPLAGRRIVVTRTKEGAARLADLLRAAGAQAYEVPLLQIEPPDSYAPLDAALSRLGSYDLLLVTSANTARVLAARRATPWPDQPRTAAMGPATANAMREQGLRVDQVPEAAVGEALLASLLPIAPGGRILLPRAMAARDLLPDGLRAAGAVVDVVTAYRTVPAEQSRSALQALFAKGAPRVDYVTFTSASTVEHFFLMLGREAALHTLQRSLACSIGPITSEALRTHGCCRYVEAAVHDIHGLVAALVQQHHAQAAL